MASNIDLDPRREMRLAREGEPGLDPVEVWRMGTLTAARAVGFQDRVGALSRGLEADLVAFRGTEAVDRRGALDALTAGAGHVAGIWIGGRQRFPNGDDSESR